MTQKPEVKIEPVKAMAYLHKGQIVGISVNPFQDPETILENTIPVEIRPITEELKPSKSRELEPITKESSCEPTAEEYKKALEYLASHNNLCLGKYFDHGYYILNENVRDNLEGFRFTGKTPLEAIRSSMSASNGGEK